MQRNLIVFAFLGLFLITVPAKAQEVHQELQETVRAEVVRVIHEQKRDIIGTDAEAVVQEIQVRIVEGEQKGNLVTFENDLMRVEAGDSIYVNRLVSIDGVEYYQLKDADRRAPLMGLTMLFVVILILFTGFHGFRALLSLILSGGAIFFILIPLLLRGYAPVASCTLVAGVVLAISLFLTHGWRRSTHIAFLGTFGAVLVTGVIATIFTKASHLTGLSSDAAIYLNFSTKGSLDFGALLLGSIMIGILGILDDVAITQASVVRELKRANEELPPRELSLRSLRVGRAHISSLVNTLSFAYVGAALPLVLLMVSADASLVLSLNQEVVAVEFIRIMVGSIGLILAVPLTTLIAVFVYHRYGLDGEEDEAHHGHEH